jgi:uncharacterized protein (TIGR02466 family)
MQSDDTITADILFPTIIWQKTINFDNNKLKSFVTGLMSATPTAHATNIGGWQSDSSKSGGLPIEFADLQVEFDKAVKIVCEQIQLPRLRLNNLWFNVNSNGSHNVLHNHMDSVISGVYYIDIPANDMGDIVFHRDDDAAYYLPPLENVNNVTTYKQTYKAATGRLILFPSWVKHEVTTNYSDKNRISMSFNYGVR